MSKKCTPLWRKAQFGPLLEVQMSKKCTPFWREAHFEVKFLKTPRVQITFGGSDVEKVHAVLARTTFRSQNFKKHQGFGPLLEVQMSKKCTPFWREAHFEVKILKNIRGSDHFWTFRCRFAWQAHGIVHLAKSEHNVRVLEHFQKPWQAWGICRGSAKMRFPWQAQYQRHVYQRC